MKTTTINPYGATLALATTPKEWAQARRRFGKSSLPKGGALAAGRTDFLTHSGSGHCAIVVWVDVADHGKALHAMLTAVHEAVHAACGLLDHIGQKYDGSSEALAYLVDWITEQLWEWISPAYDSNGMLRRSGEVPGDHESPGG